MGHIGLTPQSVHMFGGFRCKAELGASSKIVDDAKALEEAGVFAITLECVPEKLTKLIANRKCTYHWHWWEMIAMDKYW